MDPNPRNDILDLIVRCFLGVADSHEIIKLNIWIESSEENSKYFGELKNIWDASDNSLEYNDINTAEALGRTIKRLKPVTPERNLWFYWQRSAAIMILPLLITSLLLLLYRPDSDVTSATEIIYNEVHAAFGTRSQLKLSDSTIVWLNSGSCLKYPVIFNDNDRRVFLTGEAYFEVESDEAKPFIVETNNLQVRATGTKFNIQEYDKSKVSEVMLLSGKVVVIESINDNNNRLISELNANQYLSYDRDTKERLIKNEDVSRYIAWKDGKLVFRNESLEKVINKLSLLFNVDFDIKGEELKKYAYHATFQDESLEEILKLLKLSAPLDFKEISRKPLPDGSFPKKKVIIYKSN